jgi:hypothetical protein
MLETCSMAGIAKASWLQVRCAAALSIATQGSSRAGEQPPMGALPAPETDKGRLLQPFSQAKGTACGQAAPLGVEM